MEGGDKYLNNAEKITKCGLFTKLIYKIVAFDMSDLDLPISGGFQRLFFSLSFLCFFSCEFIIVITS